MVYHSRRLDLVFRALGDPTRRTILALLADGDQTIATLAGRFDMTLPAVSKHVRVLEAAGLATVRREGRSRWCRLRALPMAEAAEWLAEYRQWWEAALDRLEGYVTDGEEDAWEEQRRDRGSSCGARSRPRGRGSSARGRKRKG